MWFCWRSLCFIRTRALRLVEQMPRRRQMCNVRLSITADKTSRCLSDGSALPSPPSPPLSFSFRSLVCSLFFFFYLNASFLTSFSALSFLLLLSSRRSLAPLFFSSSPILPSFSFFSTSSCSPSYLLSFLIFLVPSSSTFLSRSRSS